MTDKPHPELLTERAQPQQITLADHSDPPKPNKLLSFFKRGLQPKVYFGAFFLAIFVLLAGVIAGSVTAAGLPNSISLKIGDQGTVQCPNGELQFVWTKAGSKRSARIACIGKLPKPTPSVKPSPSATPMPSVTPSASPSATPAPTPSGTPTPNGSAPSGGFGVGTDGGEVGINLTKFNQAKADALNHVYDRLCTPAEHDKTKWHGLVNVEAKCHYDHEHGDDPNYVNDIFGEPGAWFNKPGQSISYPWQTFTLSADMSEADALKETGTEGKKENDLKHEGYYWVVRRNQSCDGGTYCITDSRLEFHFMSSHHNEVGNRFHSFSFEGRLCRDPKDPSTCGIYRTGGWTDHGQLVITQNPSEECWIATNSVREGKDTTGQVIPLPADKQYYPLNSQGLIDELRCHKNMTDAIVKSMPNGYDHPAAEWWTHGAEDFRYVVKVFDPISNVDPSNPTGVTPANEPYCKEGDATCRWNNSIMTAGEGYTTQINKDYEGIYSDSNDDGRTDFTAGKVYVNRFGGVNKSCTTAGLDCIPFVLDKVQLGADGGGQRYSNKQCDSCQKVDHDLTPPGVGDWITWFYHKM